MYIFNTLFVNFVFKKMQKMIYEFVKITLFIFNERLMLFTSLKLFLKYGYI